MSLFNLVFSSGYKNRKERAKERGRVWKSYDIDGLSSENEYVPLIVPKMNLGIYNGKIVHYSVPKANGNGLINLNSYPRLYDRLGYTTLPFRFRTRSMEEPIYGVKGMLFKELKRSKINILFLLAVRTEYMKEMFNNVDVSGELKDLSKFAIFISREFYTSPEYKTVHNKFQKEVIKPLIDKGVELIITNNIEERCFKNNVAKPRFRSVTEMKEFLTSFNQAI
jgi:hypothetical protein